MFHRRFNCSHVALCRPLPELWRGSAIFLMGTTLAGGMNMAYKDPHQYCLSHQRSRSSGWGQARMNPPLKPTLKEKIWLARSQRSKQKWRKDLPALQRMWWRPFAMLLLPIHPHGEWERLPGGLQPSFKMQEQSGETAGLVLWRQKSCLKQTSDSLTASLNNVPLFYLGTAALSERAKKNLGGTVWKS